MRRPVQMLAVLLLCGCGATLDEQNPDTMTDQSGATFTWDCTSNRDCELGPLPVCSGSNAEPAVNWVAGRFFHIAPSCTGPSSWSSHDVRFAVCSTNADCPRLIQYRDGPTYECRTGFCQRTDHTLFPPEELPGWHEMLLLCYGATPRSDSVTSWPPAELKAKVDEACPSPDKSAPCVSVPDGCPDPRVGG